MAEEARIREEMRRWLQMTFAWGYSFLIRGTFFSINFSNVFESRAYIESRALSLFDQNIRAQSIRISYWILDD